MVLVRLNDIASLKASGKQQVGTIDITKMRTLAVTAKVNYNAGATAGIKVNAYTKLENQEWDTVAIDYFEVDFTAGETVQKTNFIAVPEEGQVAIEIENTDTTYAATEIEVLASYERW